MSKERILWVDWLKFLAIFGVIGIHVSSSLLDTDILFSSAWYQGVISASTFRFAIILFVMASGYLLLRKQQPIEVIPKRMKRILLPFIFWLVVYAIVKVVVKGELGATWNILDLMQFIIYGFIDPLVVSVQFWYVYMIIGLYLLSPILSRWIQNAPIKDIEYMLIIWVIVSIIGFIGGKFLLLDYMNYFAGAIGYFVLGYYLTIKDNVYLKDRSFGLLLFVIGTLITIIGTIGLSLLTNDQSLFFIRMGDITPGACLQAIGLFIIIKNTDYSALDSRVNEFVTKISKDSYGIYLVNILVVNVLNNRFINIREWTIFKIIILIFLVLIVSDIIIRLMDKIKFTKIFSGTA